jgi:uncharacterized protein (TIGR04255 family)
VTINYERPPVVEVVAAVSVDVKGAPVAPELPLFWDRDLRDTFPTLELQPPFPVPFERFAPGARSPELRSSFAGGYPSPRYWAKNANGTELLQLQEGWFACNWRRIDPAWQYDRWPSRRTSFERWYLTYSQWLENAGRGVPAATQCEVSYVNHIRPTPSSWQAHGDLAKIFDLRVGRDFPFTLEQGAIDLQFLLPGDAEGSTPGRLHARIQPAFGRDGLEPLYVFELTARGEPAGPDIQNVLDFLDRGRAAINIAFEGLTTDLMAREWGKQ